jgi:hypothetical protein
MVQSSRRLRQRVGARQRGPAVRARDEFLRQPERKPGMARNIGQSAHAEALGLRLAHRQSVGVVETQAHRRAQPIGGKPAIEFLQRERAFDLEDFTRDGAAVLRVQVDGTGLERRIDNAGIAQPRPVLGAAGHALRDDLAENVGFGEAFRADAQRFFARACARRGEEHAE